MKVLISQKGKNFSDTEYLSEETNITNCKAVYSGAIFDIGNRKGDEVELYRNGKFFKRVEFKDIHLLKIKF